MQRAAFGRQLRDDRRAVDAGQHLEHELGGSHQRPGITGTDAGLRPALLDEIDSDTHRRVFLLAHRIDRGIGHLHDLACMYDRQARLLTNDARDMVFKDCFVANEQ